MVKDPFITELDINDTSQMRVVWKDGHLFYEDGSFFYNLKYFLRLLAGIERLKDVSGYLKYFHVLKYLRDKGFILLTGSSLCGYTIKQKKLQLFIESINDLKIPKLKR